jgi:hypothetical protein
MVWHAGKTDVAAAAVGAGIAALGEHMKKQLVMTALIAALSLPGVLFSTHTAHAQTPTPPAEQTESKRNVIEGDKSNLGGTFILKSNETLEGDLAILGGTVRLESGSIVQGDVTLLGGTLSANGDIKGDLTQLGGTVSVGEGARIDGKFDTIGGNQKVSEGASVGQGGTSVTIPELPAIPPVPPVPPVPPIGQISGTPTPRSRIPMVDRIRDNLNRARDRFDGNMTFDNGNDGKIFPGLFMITLLAMIIAAIIPRNIMQAVELAREQPFLAGGVGVLSLLAGAIVLGVTLILIVTFLTNPLIALAAIGIGWTVTARIVGEWVMGVLKRSNWQPLGIIVAGSVLMALLGSIDIVGDVLGFGFVAVGLGAFILTRGGTQRYVLNPATQPGALTSNGSGNPQ